MKIIVLFVFFISVFTVGCLGPKKVSNIQQMKISFSFDTEGCALNSPNPEIKVENIPDGTAFFQVKMQDLNFKSFNHGGGTVENDGSGIVPKGSLKGYKGPCPSSVNTYEFTVKALNADKSLILGEGTARSSYP